MSERFLVLRKKVESVKVLTDEAQRVITNAHRHGVHGGQPNACEPPYMAPSQDTNDYSMVSNLYG
jgi:hypothetical protein